MSETNTFLDLKFQLIQLDHLSNTINDKNLPNLLELSSRINNESQDRSSREPDYQKILRHGQLLESIVQLLPKLSDCIDDSSKFDEAIKLLDQAANLNSKYGTQIAIIDHIHRRSEELRAQLVANLIDGLERLHGCSIDQVSNSIQQLFRCGNFTDRDLKLRYLQARDNWFNRICEDSSASFDDVVQAHCDGLPMIYKEYRSIFCERVWSTDDVSVGLTNRDPLGDDGAIINSWLLMKTSIFISSLEVYLGTIHQSGNQTPTMLSDTMRRCFELTDWLSSIGFDFSSRLRPLFLQAVSTEVRTSIEKATETFETHFTTTVSKSIESLLLPVEDEILRISNLRADERLPESIEHYPIFKIYCLHILNSLRWLHICRGFLSPISICLDAYEALNNSLTRLTKALATILNLDRNSRHPILTKIAISYITEVLPFLSRYCETLFPEKIILNTIGCSKAESKLISMNEPDKLRDTRLNHRQIAEPLRSIMPALLQTIE